MGGIHPMQHTFSGKKQIGPYGMENPLAIQRLTAQQRQLAHCYQVNY